MSEITRIFRLLRPHLPALLAAAGLAVVLSACQGLLVVLVKEVLANLLGGPAQDRILLLAGAVVSLFLVQGGARIGRTWLTRRAALEAERDLRNRLFAHLLQCEPAALQQDGVGDVLSRLSHDAGTIRTAVGAGVTLVQRPLTALALASAAAVMAPRLALWAALGLPVVAAVITWTGRRTRRHSQGHLEALGMLESSARDALAGLRTIQAYGAQRRAQRQFEAANREQLGSALRATLYRIAGPPAVELAAAVGIAAVIVVGSLEVSQGRLEPAALVAFLVALGLLSEPLKGFATAHGLWEEARAGMQRVFEVLDRPIQPLDWSSHTPQPDEPVTLELRDLSVDRGRGPVLQGIDLLLAAGDLVVITGASGAGKSTLLDVLGGFVEPSRGLLLWNGADASSVPLAQRRACLAFVDQDPWLGSGTVAEAIAMGRPGASHEDIARCAARAGLPSSEGLLATLPGGLDGRVGDAGGPVSGGERQRIALARALLRDAPILLLDEPTANLDPESEARFLETLKSLAGDRVVVIASHKPGPLSIATRAWRMQSGRLIRLALPETEGPTGPAATGSDAAR
jgi:ABC-type multidrug transport system fused ATPase/permease subunit